MKRFFIITILLSIINHCYAQNIDEETSEKNNFYQKHLKNKLYTGGGAGLSFGTITNASINPILGYRFNERVHGGVGLNYQYIYSKFYNVSYSSYGARAFGKYHFIPQAYILGEYSYMNIEYAYKTAWLRGWFPSLLLGAGYRQSLGGNSSYNLEVLWNIFNSPVYPINTPIIRAGINIGL